MIIDEILISFSDGVSTYELSINSDGDIQLPSVTLSEEELDLILNIINDARALFPKQVK
jgi:hypothetical protein